jgi:transposase
VKQQSLFDPVPAERFQILTREELIELAKQHQKIIVAINKDNERLRSLQEELKQKSLFIEDQYITIKGKLFGKSSERTRKHQSGGNTKNKKSRVLLPSERYPNAPLIEKHVTLDQMPSCKCCGSEMQDSGMTEESEYLTKVPAQYYVVVQVRHKYACRACHGDLVTAPIAPRVTPGGSYSDELLVDVAVSKYCDLIPIERQVQMARREGVKGLPPQSLIEGTHQFADFLKEVYRSLRQEILDAKVLMADETPHRMLEGDKKSHWFLWGFSTNKTSYFECHDTRSGDVASDLLSKSKCEFLSSDVYSGYGRAVGLTNVVRKEQGLPIIQHVYCNAHARRKFKEAVDIAKALMMKAKSSEERERLRAEYERYKYYLKQYRKIYRLEGLAQKYTQECLRIRDRQRKYFEKIRSRCMSDSGGYSSKSSIGIAMNYFLKNYDSFVRFIGNRDLSIDNNHSERLLRNPVIGRKTWYGTHSKRGAETTAVLFSLIQSCKLNHINPREYFKNLVQDLHQGKKSYTPKEYKDLQKNH